MAKGSQSILIIKFLKQWYGLYVNETTHFLKWLNALEFVSFLPTKLNVKVGKW